MFFCFVLGSLFAAVVLYLNTYKIIGFGLFVLVGFFGGGDGFKDNMHFVNCKSYMQNKILYLLGKHNYFLK